MILFNKYKIDDWYQINDFVYHKRIYVIKDSKESKGLLFPDDSNNYLLYSRIRVYKITLNSNFEWRIGMDKFPSYEYRKMYGTLDMAFETCSDATKHVDLFLTKLQTLSVFL